jgi:hypothetical protein
MVSTIVSEFAIPGLHSMKPDSICISKPTKDCYIFFNNEMFQRPEN